MPDTLLAGIGLKPEHYEPAQACTDRGLWFEVHAENYLHDGGPRLRRLERLRAEHPLSVHGVALSLAGTDALDTAHLQRLRALVQRLQPALVSEHLAWAAWSGVHLPALLPLPRSHAALQRLAERIDHVQSVLGRRLALENPAQYLPLDGHDWDEADYMNELARRTGCALLLDVNNVHVSAHNLARAPDHAAARLVDALDATAIVEIHLAGHRADPRLGQGLLIDSHDAPVAPPVWALYQRVINRIGPRPTLIERDAELPPFAELRGEAARARQVLMAANASTAAMTTAANHADTACAEATA